MSIFPRSISLPEFSLRVSARPSKGDWFVIVAPSESLVETRETLQLDVGAFMRTAPTTHSNMESARDFVRSVRSLVNGVVLVGGLEGFSGLEWQSVDLMRGALEGPRTVVLIVSPTQLDLLVEHAPNLASWLAGGIWQLKDDVEELSDTEREQRLATLRASTGLSDDEVIASAIGGTLAREPQFSEWLLLLRRSDLIERP